MGMGPYAARVTEGVVLARPRASFSVSDGGEAFPPGSRAARLFSALTAAHAQDGDPQEVLEHVENAVAELLDFYGCDLRVLSRCSNVATVTEYVRARRPEDLNLKVASAFRLLGSAYAKVTDHWRAFRYLEWGYQLVREHLAALASAPDGWKRAGGLLELPLALSTLSTRITEQSLRWSYEVAEGYLTPSAEWLRGERTRELEVGLCAAGDLLRLLGIDEERLGVLPQGVHTRLILGALVTAAQLHASMATLLEERRISEVAAKGHFNDAIFLHLQCTDRLTSAVLHAAGYLESVDRSPGRAAGWRPAAESGEGAESSVGVALRLRDLARQNMRVTWTRLHEALSTVASSDEIELALTKVDLPPQQRTLLAEAASVIALLREQPCAAIAFVQHCLHPETIAQAWTDTESDERAAAPVFTWCLLEQLSSATVTNPPPPALEEAIARYGEMKDTVSTFLDVEQLCRSWQAVYCALSGVSKGHFIMQ